MISERALVFDLFGTLIPFPEEQYGLRAGLVKAFRDYGLAGDAVVVTSTEPQLQIESVFKSSFTAELVTSCRQVSSGKNKGKHYRYVVGELGYSPDLASRRMLISGDSYSDTPNDLENIVLLHHYRGYEYHMDVHRIATEKVYEAGQGDFYEGYCQLLEASRKPKGNVLDIGDGIELKLGTVIPKSPVKEGMRNPLIEVIASEKWRRTPLGLQIPEALREVWKFGR